LIQQYLNQLHDLRTIGGSRREPVVREAFKDLIKAWAREYDLVFVPEYEIGTATRERLYVDGALLRELNVPFGYWEAEDEKDDLDAEIAAKRRRGYPHDNIIFENSTEAVLIQAGAEAMRCAVNDVRMLEKAPPPLLRKYIGTSSLPYHPRTLRHLPLRGLQGEGYRPAGARHHRERGDRRDHPRDVGRSAVGGTRPFTPLPGREGSCLLRRGREEAGNGSSTPESTKPTKPGKAMTTCSSRKGAISSGCPVRQAVVMRSRTMVTAACIFWSLMTVEPIATLARRARPQ
jgi:hypothetical protein